MTAAIIYLPFGLWPLLDFLKPDNAELESLLEGNVGTGERMRLSGLLGRRLSQGQDLRPPSFRRSIARPHPILASEAKSLLDAGIITFEQNPKVDQQPRQFVAVLFDLARLRFFLNMALNRTARLRPIARIAGLKTRSAESARKPRRACV